MADVFLSYGHSSHASARRISSALETAGYSVWFDEGIPAHRPFSEVIEEQLESARAVIVLWSREAVQSQWVRSEANRARETGRLIQVRLDDVRLPMPFDQIQCADLHGWRGKNSSVAWASVLASVAALAQGGERTTASPTRQSNRDRRTLLLAGGAAAVLSAGGLALWSQRKPPISPEAQLLVQKGLDALQANDALDPEDEGSTAQAIALLTDATRLAPSSELAWGGLALAYASRRRSAPADQKAGLEARGRAAAETALRLDPSEPRSLAALRLMSPVYRNWLAAEREARHALSKNPTYPILLFVLSDVLGSVGRWRDATELSNRLDRTKFLLPGAERKAIINLWAAGDLQAADEAIKVAAERWPQQRQIWRAQLAYLLYSGRAPEALAILNDQDKRPLDVLPGAIDAATATARVLTGQISREQGVASNLAYLKSNPERALVVAQACAAMGAAPTVFELLDGYYFGRGEWAVLAPVAGDQDRQTSPLFQPPMRALWQMPRFNDLLNRFGLTSYWASSHTKPDFRRS
jgi:tetratricopeptide (TPR) repeat protein